MRIELAMALVTLSSWSPLKVHIGVVPGAAEICACPGGGGGGGGTTNVLMPAAGLTKYMSLIRWRLQQQRALSHEVFTTARLAAGIGGGGGGAPIVLAICTVEYDVAAAAVVVVAEQ